MLKPYLKRLLIAFMALAAFAVTTAVPKAYAAPVDPIPCDDSLFYIYSSSGRSLLSTIDPNSTTTPPALVDTNTFYSGLILNAIGYNPNDGYIWAMNSNGSRNDAYIFSRDTSQPNDYRVDGPYTQTVITSGNGPYIAGTFDADGRYYLRGNTSRIYSFIPATTGGGTNPIEYDFPSGPTGNDFSDFSYAPYRTATERANSGDANRVVLLGQNQNNQDLYEIILDPDTPLSSTTRLVDGTLATTTTGGADWIDASGTYYVYDGTVSPARLLRYSEDLSNYEVVTTVTSTPERDGTACTFGVEVEKDASVPDANRGDTFDYTFTIYNQSDALTDGGSFNEQLPTVNSFDFTDTLPAGLFYVPSSIPSTILGGSATLNPSNTQLDITGLDLPYGTSSFTVTVEVDINFGNNSEPNPTQNQGFAVGSNLSFFVEDGTANEIPSDDPTTAPLDDTTDVPILDPVPVTLSYFEAQRSGDETRFAWTTSTETNNVGFNVYADTPEGQVKLNSELVPSHLIDSTEPLSYELTVSGVEATTFWLEDVDTSGRAEQHGPFTLGQPTGSPDTGQAIDWAAINAESNAKAAERAQQATQQAAQRSERAQQALAGQTDLSTATLEAFPNLNLEVNQTGIYRVTYEDLLAAGLDLNGVPARDIALVSQGQSVPVHVSQNGNFGPGGYIEFYGEALDTLYTDTNIYQLTVDSALATPMEWARARASANADIPAFYMEEATFEVDRNYGTSAPFGEPWYDLNMVGFTTEEAWDITLPVDNMVEGAAPATVLVDFYSVTAWPDNDLDHHTIIELNGTTVYDEFYDGRVVFNDLSLPGDTLTNGDNTLTFRLPGDTGAPFEVLRYDKATVTYPRAFVARDGALKFNAAGEAFTVSNLPHPNAVIYQIDGDEVSRLGNPRILADGSAFSATFNGSSSEATYVVSTAENLLTPTITPVTATEDITSGTAEYLMISHPDFVNELGDLITYHENVTGLDVRVVNIEDVYAQYSHGIIDAQAIQDYITHAHTNMGTQYVLLVGGDNYDYRNYQYADAKSFIPTLYAQTTSTVLHAPSDALLADTDGDRLPDVPLGRFPVRTSAELSNMIAKTLAYHNRGEVQTAVFAADHSEPGNDFRGHSETIVDGLSTTWDVDRAYLDDMTVSEGQQAIIDGINNGAALTSFMGHSSYSRWTFSGLFEVSDIASLTNAGQPTVVVQWGCWNTYFVSPNQQTLGHQFLFAEDAGAAAVLGAASLTDGGNTAAYGKLITPLITQEGMSLGQAMVTAKQQLHATNPNANDIILGWALLGDPTLAMEVSETSVSSEAATGTTIEEVDAQPDPAPIDGNADVGLPGQPEAQSNRDRVALFSNFFDWLTPLLPSIGSHPERQR
jgi:hypothetical protein